VRVGIRLLGRFQVDLDAQPVPVGSWNRRSAASLVKLLALAERRRLHREQVVDALWPDSTLDSALPRLHKAAHFVRKATGVQDSVVLSEGAVELFPHDDVHVDVVDFERLAAAAIGSGQPTDVDAALELYGGELLPDDLYEAWTFEPRRLAHVRRRELLRRAGRWFDLIAVDPTDEDAHEELMRVMLDAGDRSGVRHQFEMLQQVLREELGAAPGPGAVELLRRASEAANRPVVATAPAAAVLPPMLDLLADHHTFVGRASERAALLEQWAVAREGHTVLAVVAGEPGIGKSRLVSEVAREVHDAGGKVLLGACHEDVDQPYGPFSQAIVDDAARLDDDELRRAAGDAADALVRLAPELASRLPGTSSDGAHPDSSTRAEVLDAIAQWFADSAAVTPTLLVLEDVHWSTSTTRDALRHLMRRARRAPLLIVATTRDSKPDLDAGLGALLADLDRSPAVRRVKLTGLDRDEVAQLVGDGHHDAREVLAETHGNPLLVTHLTADVGGDPLPGWLHQRDRVLDDDTRDLLDQAATFGTEFDARLLAAAVDAPLLDVLALLEAAEAAGLVVPRPGSAPGFAFVHALFRSVRYRELPLRRRLTLHARAAAALGTRGAGDRLLSEHARHACLAVPVVDPRDAVDLALVAAQVDEYAYAYDEAIAHLGRALDAARHIEPPDAAVALDLEVRHAAARHHRGDPDGLPSLLDAARRADSIGDHGALVKAATAIPQFGAVGFIDPMPEGRAVTEAALAVVGDEPSAARAQLLMDLASHWLFVDVDEALQLARRAEAVARDLDDPDVLGTVLLAARHLLSHPERIDDRVRVGAELDRLGRHLDRLAFRLAGAQTLAAAHLERGQLAAWAHGFDRFTDLLGDRDLGFFRMQALNHPANRAFLAGDLAAAEELVEATVPWSVGIGAGRLFAEATIVANRRVQGRDDEVLSRFERAAARSSDAWYRCSLAAVQARSGRAAEARQTLAQLRDAGFRIREIYPWSIAVTDLAEAAEVVGDRAAAAHVLRVGGPYSGRIAVSGPSPNRPWDQALAQAALATGDVRAAVAHSARAVEASRHRQTPIFLARELVFLAEARRRSGDTAVGALVGEALEIAVPLGAKIVVDDIARYGLQG
jgi:DNA-binding SARP family transcriptional activator